MQPNIDSKERQLANRENFLVSCMSDSKWIKLFKVLSRNNNLISRCLLKDVYDDILRQVYIPTSEDFTSIFNDKWFNDEGWNQPYRFKEIEWLEFPSQWEIKREMRGETLEPIKFQQDIAMIKKTIEEFWQFEIQLTKEKLIIYGYK